MAINSILNFSFNILVLKCESSIFPSFHQNLKQNSPAQYSTYMMSMISNTNMQYVGLTCCETVVKHY